MKSTILLSAIVLLLPSCETAKQIPLTFVYEADVGGHSATVAYTSSSGVVVSAKKLRVDRGK